MLALNTDDREMTRIGATVTAENTCRTGWDLDPDVPARTDGGAERR